MDEYKKNSQSKRVKIDYSHKIEFYEEILDMMDVNLIENYLRKKKLERINKK